MGDDAHSSHNYENSELNKYYSAALLLIDNQRYFGTNLGKSFSGTTQIS
jgi:hypothetical protein